MTDSEDTYQFGINQSPNSLNTIHQSDPVQSLVEPFEEVTIKDRLEEQEESECDIVIIRNLKSRYEDEIFALQSIINAKNIEAMCYHTLSQSQKHGYNVENEIRGRVFNVSSTPNQTGTHDITKEENKYNNQENVSIKTTVSKNIDCGDILSASVRPHRGDRAGTGADARYCRRYSRGPGLQGNGRREGHPHRGVRSWPLRYGRLRQVLVRRYPGPRVPGRQSQRRSRRSTHLVIQ